MNGHTSRSAHQGHRHESATFTPFRRSGRISHPQGEERSHTAAPRLAGGHRHLLPWSWSRPSWRASPAGGPAPTRVQIGAGHTYRRHLLTCRAMRQAWFMSYPARAAVGRMPISIAPTYANIIPAGRNVGATCITPHTTATGNRTPGGCCASGCSRACALRQLRHALPPPARWRPLEPMASMMRLSSSSSPACLASS